MSIEDTNNINDSTIHVLSSFERDFSSMRDEIKRLTEYNPQIVIEMNMRPENQDKVIQRMES